LLKGRLGLLQRAGEVRTVYARQYLPGDDLLAGIDLQGDAARCCGVEGGADGCNDSTLNGHIPDEIASGDDGGSNTITGHANGGVGPAFYPRRGKQDRRDNGDANRGKNKLIAAWILRR